MLYKKLLWLIDHIIIYCIPSKFHQSLCYWLIQKEKVFEHAKSSMFHQLITGTQTGVTSFKQNLILSMPTGNYVHIKINQDSFWQLWGILACFRQCMLDCLWNLRTLSLYYIWLKYESLFLISSITRVRRDYHKYLIISFTYYKIGNKSV